MIRSHASPGYAPPNQSANNAIAVFVQQAQVAKTLRQRASLPITDDLHATVSGTTLDAAGFFTSGSTLTHWTTVKAKPLSTRLQQITIAMPGRQAQTIPLHTVRSRHPQCLQHQEHHTKGSHQRQRDAGKHNPQSARRRSLNRDAMK